MRRAKRRTMTAAILAVILAALMTAPTSDAAASGWSYVKTSSGLYAWMNPATRASDGWLYERFACPDHCGRHRWHYRRVRLAKEYELPGWRDRLVDLVEQQKVHEEWIETIRELGLRGALAGYGAGGYGNNYGETRSFSAQGRTVFGYSASSTNYGSDVDALTILEASKLLAREANGLAQTATGGTNALAAQALQNAGDVDRILAVGEAVARTKAGSPPIKSQSFELEFSVDESGTLRVEPTESSDEAELRRAAAVVIETVETRCVECHGPEDEQSLGHVRLDNLASWPDGKIAAWGPEILERIESDDPAFRMPLEAEPLDEETIADFRLVFPAKGR